MYPHLFGIKFLWTYGFCIGIGILACLWFLNYACKKLNISSKFENFVEWNAILAIVIGFGTACLFQSFYNYLENPSAGFHITKNFTFIGGLIGGVASFLIVYYAYGRKKYGPYLLELLPIAACCILVAHGFGRIGCFFGGCCYGKEVAPHTIFAMPYPVLGPDSYSSSAEWPWLYPTQLFEAAFLFIAFGICAYLTINKKYKHTMSIYLISYGIFRFLNEFLRDDDRGSFIPGLSPSQFWCIPMVIFGIALFFLMPIFFKRRDQKLALEAENAQINGEEIETTETKLEEEPINTVEENTNKTTLNNNKKDK